MNETTFRLATTSDLPAIRALLAAHHLPDAELEEWLEYVVVAERHGQLIGCGGFELYREDSVALVRSMAVESGLHGFGIGRAILDRLEERARELGLTRFFLFTVGAASFYQRFGYELVDLAEFPPSVRGSFQYVFVEKNGKEWGIIAMAKTL